MKYYIACKGWSGGNWLNAEVGELKDIQIKYRKNYNELLYNLLELLFNGEFGYIYRIIRDDGLVMFESDNDYDWNNDSIIGNLLKNQILTFKHIMLLVEKHGEKILRLFKGNKEVIEYVYNKYKQ